MLKEKSKIDECVMEKFGTLHADGSEKTVAILGDRSWSQTAKQQGDKISKKFLCNIPKNPHEPPNVAGASVRIGADPSGSDRVDMLTGPVAAARAVVATERGLNRNTICI